MTKLQKIVIIIYVLGYIVKVGDSYVTISDMVIYTLPFVALYWLFRKSS